MMPLSEIFFLGIILYLLYRFLFNFILPIVKTTRQVREQFRNMHGSVNRDQANPFQRSSAEGPGVAQAATPNGQSKKSDPASSSSTMGEYIDFEEIK